MKTLLLTGGSGFIGSHICLLLLEKGYNVFTIDSYINSSAESLKRIKKILFINSIINENLFIFKGDIRDPDILKKIFTRAIDLGKPIEGVIHLAGLKSVKDSTQDPIKYWDYNVKGTINLVGCMKEFCCNSIVFSSSATIYGNANNLLRENSLIRPVNPYGMTKVVIEKLLKDISCNTSNKWRIANLRYFNPIGSHCSGLIGESPSGTANNIFPLILDAAVGNLKKLSVFGNDWPTPDGTPIRDYIHVMDLAEAHIRALEFLMSKEPSCIDLNIGTGAGTSVLELIRIFEESNKIKIPFKFSPRRLGDVQYLVADNKLALNTLNWKPKKTIRDMCKDGWKWKKLNPSGYTKGK